MTVRTEPVVLVHGFASSFALEWQPTGWVDLLADAKREVIGVDLLGHGTAAKPHDPSAYASLEDSIAAALPAEGKVDAIGFSLGARVLLTLASQHPERFRRIVVAGIGANVLRDDDPEMVASAIAGESGQPEGIAELFVRFANLPGNDPAALAACLRGSRRALSLDDLAQVTCPVLVVLSEQDFVGPPEPLMDALPDARLVTLRGVDHFGTPKDFKFIDAALEFLDAAPAF